MFIITKDESGAIVRYTVESNNIVIGHCYHSSYRNQWEFWPGVKKNCFTPEELLELAQRLGDLPAPS